MFSRFVNPYVSRNLIAHWRLNRAGESRQITVAVLRHPRFTTLSERHTPQQVVELAEPLFQPAGRGDLPARRLAGQIHR